MPLLKIMIAMMKKMQFHQLDHIDRDDYEGGDETDDEDWLSYKPLSKEVLRKDTSYRHRAVLLSVRSTSTVECTQYSTVECTRCIRE